MKNIEISMIEKFNRELDSGKMSDEKTIIEKFMRATILHLEEDIKRVKNSTYLNDLYTKAIREEENVLKKQRLNIENFQKFNDYNTAKIKEIRWIAIATVVLFIVAVIFHVIFN